MSHKAAKRQRKEQKVNGNGQNNQAMPQPGQTIAKMAIEAIFDPNQPDGIGLKISHPLNLKLSMLILSKAAYTLATKKLPDDLVEEESRVHKATGAAVAQFGRG